MKFTLYSYFRSSTSYRARIALHHKNINFEYKPVHLLDEGGQQNKPEYRELNPMGGVPTLVHGPHVISQSRAIIEYLDYLLSQNPLQPEDLFLRARMRQICDNINCEMHPLSNLRVTQYLEREWQKDEPARIAWIHHWYKIGLSATEKLLEDTAGTYAIGSEVTMADLFLVPHIFTSNRFKVPLENYPILRRVTENALKLPAFEKAHPFRQPDTPAEMRIN